MNVIWLPHFNFTPYDYSTLTHELLHITLNTVRLVGIKFDFENQEPITYYIDYMMKKVLEKLFKLHKRKIK